jgi:ligand-binding sensor domain-containing protein
VQTPDHYLWIGTGRGLVRYDGHEFEVVPTPGIDQIDWIHLDRQHRIWIGTWTNRLALVEDGKVRLLPEVPGYESRSEQVRNLERILSFSESVDGSIWLGGGNGLVRTHSDRPGTWTRYTTADGLPGASVHGVFDLPGDERVAVTGEGVARLLVGGSPTDIRFQPIGPPAISGATSS